MSPRSVLPLVLLAALAAAATWSDVMVAVTYNVSAVKWCSVNTADKCYFLPAWNASVDPRKGLAVIETYPYIYGYNVMAVPSLYMLKMIYNSYYELPAYSLDIYIDRPGYLYSEFANFTVNGRASGPWSICNGKVYLNNGHWIQAPGTYRVVVNDGRGRGDKLYFYEETTCAVYAVVASINSANYLNITRRWITVTLYYLKTGRRGDIQGAWFPWARPADSWINGTKHLYTLRTNSMVAIGDGWYIANKTRVPTVLALHPTSYFYYGPSHFDALSETRVSWPYGNVLVQFMAVGADPGDGAVFVKLPTSFYGSAQFAYISNETAGYIKVRDFWFSKQSNWAGRDLTLVLQRYSLVEVTLMDDIYMYNTRGLACPPYINMSVNPPLELSAVRMDRAREFEICNNQTSPVYIALWVPSALGPHGGYYTFVDKIEPGMCAKARWDGQYTNTKTRLDFYYRPQDYCVKSPAFSIAGGNYTYGYRYFLMANNTLVQGPPISPDTAFIDMWRMLMELMAQQYNETLNATKQWLQMQANMTKSLEDYYKSLPRYQDTVKMNSSTSVWVNAVYNVLKSYVASAPPTGGSFTPIAVPPPPVAMAPAAAAAVAVAWAASRRDDDVATTAAVAGTALALFGILMSLVYGADSLTLVALGIIVAAAAAAWKKT